MGGEREGEVCYFLASDSDGGTPLPSCEDLGVNAVFNVRFVRLCV